MPIIFSLFLSTICKGQQDPQKAAQKRVVLASGYHGASSLMRVITLMSVQSPTQQERQAALFNSTAVHASFGDVELAQITLRGVSTLVPSRFTDLQTWSCLH